MAFGFFLVVRLAAAQVGDPFQWTVDTQPRFVRPGEEFPIEVAFVIPPRGYLYQDKMSLSILEGEGFEIAPLEFTPGVRKKDPFTGQVHDVFEGGTIIRTRLKAKEGTGEKQLKLLLTYQGCSETLCYRLMKREIEIPVILGTGAVSRGSFFRNLWDPAANPFRHEGIFLLLLLTFLGGLASDFTPCVLPIIPITLAFIGLRKGENRPARNFLLTLVFVLAMSLTYAGLGVFAAALGKSLGFIFQNGLFLAFAALLYLVLALSLFGLFEIQLPLPVRNGLAKLGGAGFIGSILSGFTIGFLAAPCIGPLIASLLLYVAQDRNLLKGFLLLFTYGLGMGSLFLVVGTFYHRLASKVHGGVFMVWVRRVFAILLLVPAAYYGSIAWAHLSPETGRTENPLWIHDPQAGFARAAAEGKPLFVDFFASWCLPCVEMEKGTFIDEELRRFLKEHYVPVKVDCTEETASCEEMVERYSIVGWPTFLILSPEGNVIESIVGRRLSASELRERLENHLPKSPLAPL